MTYAEQSVVNGRDDDHMIYEMFHVSQYEDGSVLDCARMESYTAQQVVNGTADRIYPSKVIIDDLKRNARAAIKKGQTNNLAPRVG